MSTPITVAELVVDMEQMMKKVCYEEGIDYNEFLVALSVAMDRRLYDPYKIGYKLFQDGHGISSIWGAVKCDGDMDECHRGYDDAMKSV